MKKDQLLTPKQVAEKLQINYRKVLELIALGKLNAYRIGSVYRIEPGELFDFLQKHKYKSYWKGKL